MSESLKPIGQYKTLIFDCDGVLFNSNKIKTQAFYDVAKIYGDVPAQALKDYHVQNGGISRYMKFEYFLTEILKKTIDQTELEALLHSFSDEVKKALMICDVVSGLEELRKKTKYSNWLIVSGGDQAELREVFKARKLDHYFDSGIFGSPATKEIILAQELANGNITRPALFLGDSKYDYKSAKSVGLNFVFISQWTEVENYSSWCKKNKILFLKNISNIGSG